MFMKTYEDITLILPTLNEEQTIGKSIKYVLKEFPEMKILVVDGNSKDRTAEIVKEFASQNKNVFLLQNSAVIDGIEKANTKYIIYIDEGLEYPLNLNKIKIIAEKLKQGNDVVIDFLTGFMGFKRSLFISA